MAVDFLTAAVRRLRASQEFADLVTTGLVGTESEGSVDQSWVFQGKMTDNVPFRDVEGTGTSAIVLASRQDWSVNAHNSARFPVLDVLIFSDATREDDGAPVVRDADDKCVEIFRVVKNTFHMLNKPEDHLWPGGRYVHGCVMSQPLSMTNVPQTEDYVVRGQLQFEAQTDE